MTMRKCDRCHGEIGPTNSNVKYQSVEVNNHPKKFMGAQPEDKVLCLGCAEELDAFFNGEKVYECDFENEEEEVAS